MALKVWIVRKLFSQLFWKVVRIDTQNSNIALYRPPTNHVLETNISSPWYHWESLIYVYTTRQISRRPENPVKTSHGCQDSTVLAKLAVEATMKNHSERGDGLWKECDHAVKMQRAGVSFCILLYNDTSEKLVLELELTSSRSQSVGRSSGPPLSSSSSLYSSSESSSKQGNEYSILKERACEIADGKRQRTIKVKKRTKIKMGLVEAHRIHTTAQNRHTPSLRVRRRLDS